MKILGKNIRDLVLWKIWESRKRIMLTKPKDNNQKFKMKSEVMKKWKTLKTTLLTLTLTAMLLTTIFASTNVLDDFTGWYYNKNTQAWNYYLKG